MGKPNMGNANSCGCRAERNGERRILTAKDIDGLATAAHDACEIASYFQVHYA